MFFHFGKNTRIKTFHRFNFRQHIVEFLRKFFILKGLKFGVTSTTMQPNRPYVGFKYTTNKCKGRADMFIFYKQDNRFVVFQSNIQTASR